MPDFSFGGNCVKVYFGAFHYPELLESVGFCYFGKHGRVDWDEAQTLGSKVVHQGCVFNLCDDHRPGVNRIEPLFQYSS